MMKQEVKGKLIRALQDLVNTGEKLRKNEDYAAELKNYYQYANSVKKYVLKNIDDEYIKQRLSDMPKGTKDKTFFPYLSFILGVSVSSYRLAEDDIDKIISIANSILSHILYQGLEK